MNGNDQGWGQPPQQPPMGGPPGPGGYPPPQGGYPPAGGYGAPPGVAPFASAKASGYVPTEDEKQAAFFAHLFAAIANFVTCGMLLPVAAPLIALAMVKQKGPFVLFHINQSFVFQAALFAINFGLGIVISIIAFFTCGIGGILYILNAIPPVIGAVYALVVAMSAKNGEWSEYAVVGPKVLESQSPLFK